MVYIDMETKPTEILKSFVITALSHIESRDPTLHTDCEVIRRITRELERRIENPEPDTGFASRLASSRIAALKDQYRS